MKKIFNYYRPALGESWLIMIGILLLGGSALTVIVVSLFNLIFPDTLSFTNPGGWAMPILYVVPFLAVFLYVSLRALTNYRKAVTTDTPSYPNPRAKIGKVPVVIFILLLFVMIVSMSVILDPVTEWLEMPEFIKKMFEKMTQSNLPTFIAIVVAAPLLEEWLLRSVALKGMLQHMDPWKAILWSALMFGVIHGNPWQAIPAFLMGCLFGWIYYRTRSYWACVALHAINNGISFLLVAVLPHIEADASLRQLVGNQSFFIALGLSVAALGLSLFYLYKNLAPPPSLKLTYEYKEPISPSL
ncbi:MAG: CPBP family intramembrane metalloprotease [Bacteroidales bacterium]|nr:CPBP family intramembrane metalloprotease [Bacteroidales bacterium]